MSLFAGGGRTRDRADDRVRDETEHDDRGEHREELPQRPDPEKQREQDQAVEQVAGIGRAGEHLLERPHDDPARDRAGDAPGSAEHEAREDQDQDALGEVRREDAPLLRGKQRAPEGANCGAEAERHHFQLVDRDRHRGRGQRIVAQRAPRASGSRSVEQVQEPG
ncbi:MAG: hypothetical protein WA803_03395 [Steroidobacteraceae bacterium]